MATYAGIAHFYAALPSDFDLATSKLSSSCIKALGHANFILQAGSRAVIVCPQPWIPASTQLAAGSVVVQLHDPFIDPLQRPFDAIVDRHVARHDILPYLTGTWEGVYSLTAQLTPPFPIRLILLQRQAIVNMEAFVQVQGRLPATPQQTGSGTSCRKQSANCHYRATGGVPLTMNECTLSLNNLNKLHVEHPHPFSDARRSSRKILHLRGDLAWV